MQFWLLAPVGAINMLAWYLIIRHDGKITRSNEVPFAVIGGVLSASAIVFFLIALVKLGLNSWERSSSIDNYAYASAMAGVVSTALLARPFVYEFRHRRDSIAPANILKFQFKKTSPQASQDPPDDSPTAA
ncbi:MAG: hypothetical protein WCV71_02480 [Patescibacteria group bacterium]